MLVELSLFLKLGTILCKVEFIIYLLYFSVVTRVGRSLATYLKTLAPTWFLSCSDPHQPASAIASKTFEKAFSSKAKQKAAIFLRQDEILEHIADNLLVQTPSTLSDPA